MCVGPYPYTEPCGRALTQSLVGTVPLSLLILPLAGRALPTRRVCGRVPGLGVWGGLGSVCVGNRELCRIP